MEDFRILLALILILTGLFILILPSGTEREVHIAFGGFIGPIPFGFATSKEVFILLLILMLLSLLIYFYLLKHPI